MLPVQQRPSIWSAASMGKRLYRICAASLDTVEEYFNVEQLSSWYFFVFYGAALYLIYFTLLQFSLWFLLM
jgi:hypothetical protein